MKFLEKLSKMQTGKRQYHSLLVLLACGVLLMLLPGASDNDSTEETNELSYSIEKEEQRLESILSNIEGVGKCRVLLSVHNGAETVLAEDDGETVVLSGGGKQSTVAVQTRYPEFQGAIIVSGGCSDVSVRFDILSSVMAYTGLEADRITICPIKE